MSGTERFDIAELLAQRGGERYDLAREYLNPQLSRMLHAIGFDRIYTRGTAPISTTRTARPTSTCWRASACSRSGGTTR